MTEREYIERATKECREIWFKDHKATVIGRATGDVILIAWEKAGTWNYGCRFILHQRWLTVVGDIGEAIYEWGQDISLPFLAGLNLSYFLGKCQASEVGRRFIQWDSGVAAAELGHWMGERAREGGVEHREILGALSDKDPQEEWQRTAERIYDETDDAELASMITGLGEVPNIRAITHWVGIKMAAGQLAQCT